jgi:recombinational DNA repair protein (RecF pathway)
MRTAVGNADYPLWRGCLCCGRTDAEGYVPVAEREFLCYRCLDKLHAERRENARLIRRWAWRRRLTSWTRWPRRRHC